MSDMQAQAAATVALTVFVVAGAVRSAQPVAVVISATAIAVGASLLISGNRWRLVAAAIVSGAAVVVVCGGSDSAASSASAANVGWFGLCLLCGWCVVRGSALIGAVFGAAAIAVFVVEWTSADRDPGWAAWIAGTLFTLVVCVLGMRQSMLLQQLRAAQESLADQARADERTRIARELHDVIAHSLTVSLLHVTSARLALDEEPQAAMAALIEAERLGLESLTEVRRTVGLLRPADGGELAPMPGADRLPDLIEGFRRAGSKINYQASGDPARLGATVGLTTYRIVQEALTNAARHAPNSTVTVELDVAADETRLTVLSSGTPGPAAPAGGMGLANMTERAESIGGTLSVGPVADGWEVHARLPGTAVVPPVRTSAAPG